MTHQTELPGIPSLSSEGVADIPPLEAPFLEPETPPAPASTDGGKPKRKRGRPPKNAALAEPSPAPSGPTPEDVARLQTAMRAGFQVAGNLLAATRGPHWQLQDEEVATLGDAWGVALAPYMGAVGAYMPLLMASAATVGVFLPRVMADRQTVKGPPAPAVLVNIPPAQAPAPDLNPPNGDVTIAPPPGRRRPAVNGGTTP